MKKLKTAEYKDAINCWIDPDGNLYRCGYMGHNEWAYEYLAKKFRCKEFEVNDKIKKVVGDYGYPYQYLTEKGWFRVLTWGTTNGTSLISDCEGDRPNKAQEETMYIWCSLNNYEYENLFKR